MMSKNRGVQIAIDENLHTLIPPLSKEEYEQLEANMLADGCRDALVVWGNSGNDIPILLDGHNRKRICDQHGLTYRVKIVELPDCEAAADWIDKNQLGRRNLPARVTSKIRGRIYNRAKRQGARTDLTSPQIEGKSTAEQLAEQHGVSRATIERDGQFAEDVETVKEVEPNIESMIASKGGPSRAAVKKAAEAIKSGNHKKAKETLKSRKKKRMKSKRVKLHVDPKSPKKAKSGDSPAEKLWQMWCLYCAELWTQMSCDQQNEFLISLKKQTEE